MSVNQNPANVLVVEDEAFLLFAIADDLREAGFNVLEATNADQAIKLLETHKDISILFTDIDMPGSMDGLRLSAAVRDRWPPVKIIVTSGKRQPDSGALPEGGVFLPKPYAPATVAATIHTLLA
jgi:CheY-like chemotaxis protein